MADAELIRSAYIRLCRDGKFKLDPYNAAAFVGDMLNIHPLEVGFAFPSLTDMAEIGRGTHAALKENGGKL